MCVCVRVRACVCVCVKLIKVDRLQKWIIWKQGGLINCGLAGIKAQWHIFSGSCSSVRAVAAHQISARSRQALINRDETICFPAITSSKLLLHLLLFNEPSLSLRLLENIRSVSYRHHLLGETNKLWCTPAIIWNVTPLLFYWGVNQPSSSIVIMSVRKH